MSLWTFEVYWRRLLLGSSAVMLAGYLGATTALFYWLGRNPQNQVGWTDILLAPVRWEEFRERRGDTAIATAMVRLKERDYVEGFHGLRVGLARSPGNVKGRLALASLYRGHDPAQALKVLEAGLNFSAHDPDFLSVLFGFYAAQRAHGRALEIIAELLAPARQPPLPGEARHLLAATRAALLIEKGRAAEAQAEFARLPLARAPGMEDFRIEAELAIAADDAGALEGALRRMR
ncbi:MAG: hypothetical protein Q8J74_08020, partial [Candidatus Didemnitutus sp.]|nr:hypothetical protein [Candidatus Didemnitutus sp.]